MEGKYLYCRVSLDIFRVYIYLCNDVRFLCILMANFCLLHLFIQELPEEAKEAAKKLGYTKKMWDSDKGMYVWMVIVYMYV